MGEPFPAHPGIERGLGLLYLIKISGATVWFHETYLFLCMLHYAKTFCYV